MSRYQKISSGSGFHGTKYELNLALYYLLNAYESKENFQLSIGKKDNLQLGDILLQTDSSRLISEVTHNDNGAKKINSNQLFGQNGKYSLMSYLKVNYEEVFQKFLHDIQEHLEQLLIITREDTETSLEEASQLLAMSKTICNQIREELFGTFILRLRNLNNEKLNQILLTFQNTNFYLVTNIFPNEELTNSYKMSSPNSTILNIFKETDRCYNFKTEMSVNTLSKIIKTSNIPNWFLNIFLDKFHLAIVLDETLKVNIDTLLKLSCSNLEIPYEFTYNDIYKLVEDWQNDKSCVFLTREEVSYSFFAYLISKKFRNELKTHESTVDFNIRPLLDHMNNNLITLVKTPRYLPVMAVLQRTFGEKDLEQMLFVSPLLTPEKQMLLIKAFLHHKYTHLVYALEKTANGFKTLLTDIIEKIAQNCEFLKYKKLILFCDEYVEIGFAQNEILSDKSWYKERKLNFVRIPNTLGSLESYYVPRLICRNTAKISEDDFVESIGKNRKKFIVIANSAGMGKTCILRSFSVAINSNNFYWSIIIQLNRFTELLERNQELGTVPKLDDFVHLLVKTPFERQICKFPKVLIVMVDGFDEISPDYTNIVTEFLKNTLPLKNVKSVVVTTRKHFKEHLEKKLGVKSYYLEPLSDDNICSLIGKFGKINLNTINDWYDSIPINFRDFFMNPLHVKMFAASSQLNAQITNNINLYKLYEDFVHNKKEIFIKEKCNCQGNVHVKKIQNEYFRNMLENYMKLALEMTFKNDLLEQFGIEKTNTFSEDMCVNGILEFSQSSVVFVHETLKEFLVAKWITRMILNSNNDNLETLNLILENIFMKSFQCKRFIDAFLEDNWNLMTDDILQNVGHIVSNSNIFIDMNYLNYDYPYIIRLMVEKCESSFLANKLFEDFINLENDILQIDLIALLIQKGAKIDYRNRKGRNLLHIAAMKGYLDLVKILIEGHVFATDVEDNMGLSPLILALLENKKEVSEYLINNGADIHMLSVKMGMIVFRNTHSVEIKFLHRPRNRFYLTFPAKLNCLHVAAFKGNLNLIKFILSKNLFSVHDNTPDGWRVLHCAVQSGNLDVVKYLVGLEAKTNERTNRDETVLHIAVYNGNLDMVKYFIEINVEVDAVNKAGMTALTLASNRLRYDIVESLLEAYLKLNLKDTTSIYNALIILLRKEQYNGLFEVVYNKYKDIFSENFSSEFLNDAIRCQNLQIVNVIQCQQI